MCFPIRLEKPFLEADPTVDKEERLGYRCGKCCTCSPVTWVPIMATFPPYIRTQSGLPFPGLTNNQHRTSLSSVPIHISNKTEDWIIRKTVDDFVSKMNNRCPICYENFDGADHYQKDCQNQQFFESNQTRRCNLCLSSNHLWNEIKQRFDAHPNEKELQYEESQQCAVLITGCTASFNNKLCPLCLLEHASGRTQCAAKRYFVRSILFKTFYDSARKNDFISVHCNEQMKQALSKVDDFPKFFRWAVYLRSGTSSLANVYLVIASHASLPIPE